MSKKMIKKVSATLVGTAMLLGMCVPGMHSANAEDISSEGTYSVPFSMDADTPSLDFSVTLPAEITNNTPFDITLNRADLTNSSESLTLSFTGGVRTNGGGYVEDIGQNQGYTMYDANGQEDGCFEIQSDGMTIPYNQTIVGLAARTNYTTPETWTYTPKAYDNVQPGEHTGTMDILVEAN